MNCSKCGTRNPAEALHCIRCGAKLVSLNEADTFAGISMPPLPPSDSPTLPPVPRPTAPSSLNEMVTAGPWAAAAAPAMDTVDFGPRYRIERMLGQGGMGAVYKAYDKELDRTVALKLVRPDLAAEPQAMARFKQELLLASKISHKNILRIHDLGEAAGVKFISMAYVQGQDLHGLLQRGRLTIDEALHITRQLCAALEAAHAEGVVHRDLKPQNVLLDEQRNVYITDFGLAKSLESDTGMTMSGQYLGTPRYMAPEQVEAHKIDHRADLYALGLILYEMCTGDVPFHADTPLQLMYKRVHETPRSPAELNPDLPPWLVQIIVKAIDKDPDRRYQGAREILNDIDAARAPSVMLPPPPVKGPETRQISFDVPAFTWRKAAIGAAVLVALLAALFAIPAVRNRVLGTSVSSGPHKPITVLVADFTNGTSDSVFDGTLEPTLGVALEGASFISTFNRGTARKLAAQVKPGATQLDAEIARLVAAREGIAVVVTGDVESAGNQYKITLSALDGLTGKTMVSGDVEAQKKDVLSAVGKLAAKIRRALGDSTPESVQEAAAETFTTTSLEAAHEYALAQDAQYTGKWDDATQHYLKATQLDPTMGRAYSGLAVIAFNTGHLADADKYFKQALSNIDRMSDREKYRTRGTYYLSVGNLDKGIEELSQLVQQFPADTAGLSNLALAYSWRRDWPKALDAARQSIAINPKSLLQQSNYGLYLTYAGQFAEAVKAQKAILQQNASFVKAYVGLAFAEIGQGHIPEAAAQWQQLAKISPEGASRAVLGLADLALYEGRSADAIALLKKGADDDFAAKNPDFAALKLDLLAHAQQLQGQAAAARGSVDKAAASSQDDAVQFWAAREELAAGNDSAALAIAQHLGNEIGAEQRADAKLIEGEVQLKRGKVQDALQSFRAAHDILDTWLAHFDLARAYVEAGAFAEADSETDICIKRRAETTSAFLDEEPTAYLFPDVYYYQGRALEGLKSPDAVNAYKNFLAIRTNGTDSLVVDARRRAGVK